MFHRLNESWHGNKLKYVKQDLFWHKLLYSGFRYDFENTYSPNVEWLLSLAVLEKITVNLMFFLLIFLRATTNEQVLLLKLVRQPRFFNLSTCFFPAYIPANNEQVLLLQFVRHHAFLTSVFFAFLSSYIPVSNKQRTSTSLTIWATNSLFIPQYSNEIVCLFSYTNDRDDPRFPTVRGVLRRGMTVEGLREFIVLQVGPNNETSLWIPHSCCGRWRYCFVPHSKRIQF